MPWTSCQSLFLTQVQQNLPCPLHPHHLVYVCLSGGWGLFAFKEAALTDFQKIISWSSPLPPRLFYNLLPPHHHLACAQKAEHIRNLCPALHFPLVKYFSGSSWSGLQDMKTKVNHITRWLVRKENNSTSERGPRELIWRGSYLGWSFTKREKQRYYVSQDHCHNERHCGTKIHANKGHTHS